jgi:peptidoglycan/LPS O-acetylase OafA/YrhL
MMHHLGAEAVAQSLYHRGDKVLGLIARTIGSSGVELFFVLSGTVLARPYLRNGRYFEFGTYMRRRVERLFPPYWAAWLVSGLSIYLVSRFPSWWTEIAYLAPFRMGDWFKQLGILYFGNANFNFAWWSLKTEILFYLLVPLLVPLIATVPARTSHGVAIIGAVIFAALSTPIAFPSMMKWFWEPVSALFTYASCFAAGLILARVDLPRGLAHALFVIGALEVLAAAFFPAIHVHVGYGLIYTAIVSRALDPNSRIARPLAHWRLVWLGERSYSLFLVHGSVIIIVFHLVSLVMQRGPAFIVLTRLIAVPLAVFTAMLVFSVVERRFARGLITGNHFWPTVPPEQSESER